jgi:NAD(P)-dependent dehydrogenase (short-subunit alcohol dehydrogenase family)
LCLQAEFGRLDVLVNNAGYTWDGVIHKMGDKQWQVRGIAVSMRCTNRPDRAEQV